MLSESTGGDDEFAQELFGDLVPRARALRDLISQAVEQRQPDTVRKSAHELKGSCLTLGAERLAAVARDLEHLGRSGNVESGAPLVARLDEELATLVKHLGEKGLLAV